MTLNLPLVTAGLVTGLFGSVHCVAMCGGIVGAFTMTPGAPARRAFPLWYHLGRIASYATAGAAVGLIGGTLLDAAALARVTGVGAVVAGGFMILLGLYMASWWNGLAVLERAGAHLWRRIEPYGRPLLPARRPRQALLLGVLWGWLPCGMVYSALAGAAVSGDVLNGALVMIAFGVGTMPLLLTLGSGIGRARRLGNAWRTTAAVALIVMGVYMVLRPALRDPHMEHAGHTAHMRAPAAATNSASGPARRGNLQP